MTRPPAATPGTPVDLRRPGVFRLTTSDSPVALAGDVAMMLRALIMVGEAGDASGVTTDARIDATGEAEAAVAELRALGLAVKFNRAQSWRGGPIFRHYSLPAGQAEELAAPPIEWRVP